MARLAEDFPPGLSYEIVYNPTEFIEQSIDAVYITLFEAVILVVLVVLIFLQSWRTALIPIAAIPVSLIGTFVFMAAMGFSINLLTLFGLVLAIGIVVDDAILVVENVERNVREGLSPREAAHKTMDEVGSAIIATSVVLAAVFVPTAFIPGITGQFYQQFAVTIIVSTAISTFNSLTLSPALAALLLKPHDAPKPKFFLARGGRLVRRPLQRRFRSVQRRLCRYRQAPCRRQGHAPRHDAGLCRPALWHLSGVPVGAARVYPAARPGLRHRRRAAARWRVAQPDRRGRSARDGNREEHPGRQERRRVCRLLRRDLHQRDQLRRHLRRVRAVRDTPGRRPAGRFDHRSALWRPAADPGGLHHRHPAAALCAASAMPAVSS